MVRLELQDRGCGEAMRLLAADMTAEAVEAELMKLKSAAILSGYRGAPALDVYG